MGSIRQSLQTEPKNIKKLSVHQIYQSRQKKIKKKSMLSTFNKKWSQKFVWELHDGICRLNPKS
jgi:hypothetical protein